MTKVNALAEATKLVRDLEKSNADKLSTHTMAVQVYLRASTRLSSYLYLKQCLGIIYFGLF